MEVILLEKVDNLGNIGDKVRVRPGYCRNYLLPKGKAALATPENLTAFETRRAEFEARHAAELAHANSRAAQLADLKLSLTAKAGSEGKLYGSLGTVDIAEGCTAAGVDVKRSEVRLPDGPIRALGDHAVEIHLHTDVNATITVSVIAEQGE